jgi:FixJ family two-component response regulator
MPGVSGLDFQAELNREGVALPIIFMTGHGDIPMSVRAMKAGAVDFLAKPFRDQDLLDAIHAALTADRERRQRDQARNGVTARYATLTPR